MSDQITVTEKMSKFIDWCYALGEEDVRRRVREKIVELRNMPQNMRDKNGFFWDIRLEPNDEEDQYRHGGDCNLCRRKDYCKTQCGANKALKKITTPTLYQMYLDENEDAAAEQAAETLGRMTPEDILNMAGINPAKAVEVGANENKSE